MTLPRPIPVEYLDRFALDPETGAIIKTTSAYRWSAGHVMHSYRKVTVDGCAYRFVKIDRRFWLEHRIIWFLHYREQPPDIIDHKNGDGEDNRIENLRAATATQNTANKRRPRNRDLPKGVRRNRSGTYLARISLGGHRRDLGSFPTPELASAAYFAAAQAAHGEFARQD